MRNLALKHLDARNDLRLYAVVYEGVVPALAIAATDENGTRLELWINVRRARTLADYQSGDAYDHMSSFSDTWDSGDFKGSSKRLRGGRWSQDIARFVESQLGDVRCMAGELSGVNRRAFDYTLESCTRLSIDRLTALAIATGATPFWRSRYKLGYTHTKIADSYLPDDVVILMYKPGLLPEIIRTLAAMQKRRVGGLKDPNWKDLP